MARLSIGYSDSEDRIWIALSGDDRQWWLTRRALLRWVQELAKMLGRPTDPDADADAVWTVPPARRLALEHEIATRDDAPEPGAGNDAQPDPPPTPRRPVLASSITMAPGRQGVVTTLRGPGEAQRLGLSRIETHRLLGALARQARSRGWFDVVLLPDWLSGPAAAGDPHSGAADGAVAGQRVAGDPAGPGAAGPS